MNDDIWTTKQVAEYMKISVAQVNAFRAYGTGPIYMKIGKLVRYRREDVEKWLFGQKIKRKELF
ncbi:MAG: helix-turn-helix domain-containing protein [Alphaproteobacteria bacterium]|nr:helix-turn-helix domain-containing protein [Alphaproteobacteria bacterium]